MAAPSVQRNVVDILSPGDLENLTRENRCLYKDNSKPRNIAPSKYTRYTVYRILYMYIVYVQNILLEVTPPRCMEDSHLPYSLRASFCRIMQCVHLDINPQETVSPVLYARLWDQIAGSTVISEYCPWKDT